MRSWKFPQMLNTNSSNIFTSDINLDQTKQNLKLLLASEKGDLICDPYFGVWLKKFMFDQNSKVLKDALTDEIFTQVALFIPQLRVKREDIKIIQDKQKAKAYITISGINQLDFKRENYQLVLFNSDNSTM